MILDEETVQKVKKRRLPDFAGTEGGSRLSCAGQNEAGATSFAINYFFLQGIG